MLDHLHVQVLGLQCMFASNFEQDMDCTVRYGQRIGCLSVVTGSPDEAKRVESQLKVICRVAFQLHLLSARLMACLKHACHSLSIICATIAYAS